MTALKSCRRCPRFQGISYVHPDGMGHLRYKIPHGWHVRCGSVDDYTDIMIPGATSVEGLPCESYQVLKRFLRLNAGRQVECPHEVREPAKATGQMKLFEEATL